MHNIIERKLAIQWRTEGLSYSAIATRLNMTRDGACNLCVYKLKRIKLKTGPKLKIDKASKLRIKRRICGFNENKEKVNATKIIEECDLDVSRSTVQRYLRKTGFIYKRMSSRIHLTAGQKQLRMQCVRSWISLNHDWDLTIFSDEKRFSLDGPDDWRSYVQKSSPSYRIKRQCKGGSVMVWMMTMPNGLMSFKVVKGNMNSDGYIKLLSESAVPMTKLNYGENWWFQEDNASVHKSKKVKEFMKKSGISVLEWPAKSPDLNIVEDCWKTISDLVYDGNQFNGKDGLVQKITAVINHLNANKRYKLIDLYKSIRHRLCTVLEKHGDLYNR